MFLFKSNQNYIIMAQDMNFKFSAISIDSEKEIKLTFNASMRYSVIDSAIDFFEILRNSLTKTFSEEAFFIKGRTAQDFENSYNYYQCCDEYLKVMNYDYYNPLDIHEKVVPEWFVDFQVTEGKTFLTIEDDENTVKLFLNNFTLEEINSLKSALIKTNRFEYIKN